jgi:NADH-quinone oxidoreductase subunit J
MIVNLAFYIFSSVLILSALIVISSRNPIYSVLFLILAFFNSAALFLLSNAEFLAMLLVIVYVGAVALLFLFVIMMLNIEFKSKSILKTKYLITGLVVAIILFVEILLVVNSIDISISANELVDISKTHMMTNETNTAQIGKILYTDFFLHFQLAGLVLLVGMIGSVVLAHRHKEDLKRQNITKQVSRKRKDSVKIVKVLSHKGI